MKSSSLIKHPYIPLIAFLIFLVVGMFLHHSFKPTEATSKTRLLNAQSNSERRDLVQVLRRATMADRSVILTIVDKAWASPDSVLDLFLESFRRGQGTQRFLNHLVIVTLDTQAFQYCNSIHPHCFQITPFGSKLAMRKGLFTSLDHTMLGRKRLDLLLQVIELGYSVVFTEADVMWLRSPLQHFHPTYELTISCGSNLLDVGPFFMKSDGILIEFLKFWQMERNLFPSLYKSFCEMTKRREILDMVGMRIKYLDTAYFGGFCQPNKDMNISEVCTMHASCCDNIKSKVHDLRLVLDVWINYTARLSANVSLGSSSFSWRVPKKCIR